MLAMFSIEIDHSKTISFRNEPLFHFCSSISNKMANNDEFIQFSPQIPLVTVIQLGYFCLRIKRKNANYLNWELSLKSDPYLLIFGFTELFEGITKPPSGVLNWC